MVAQFLYKNGAYYCSNCRMRVNGEFEAHCAFCGYTWSNYEDVLIELYEDMLKPDT